MSGICNSVSFGIFVKWQRLVVENHEKFYHETMKDYKIEEIK